MLDESMLSYVLAPGGLAVHGKFFKLCIRTKDGDTYPRKVKWEYDQHSKSTQHDKNCKHAQFTLVPVQIARQMPRVISYQLIIAYYYSLSAL